MKEYKEIYHDIEYHVIEVYDKEIKGTPLVEYTKLHKYTIIRKFEDGKLFKEMIFKDGLIHNEFDRAIFRINRFNKSIPHLGFFLKSESFDDEEEFKNGIRKVRLDDTLQN